MKIKIITAALALALTAAYITSCAESLAPSVFSDAEAQNGVTMHTQFEVYEEDIDKIQVILKNSTGSELTFGSSYALEVKQGGEWRTVPFVENTAWNDLAYILGADGTHNFTVHTSIFDHTFSDGEYRVVKDVGGKVCFAEFEIGKSAVSLESPYGYLPLDKLPEGYTLADAVSDGSIDVSAVTEADEARIAAFFDSIESGVNTQLRLVREIKTKSESGGLIITDITAEYLLGRWRIMLTVYSPKLGGKLIPEYFSNIVTDGVRFYLSNQNSFDEADTSLTPLLDGISWEGIAEHISMTAKRCETMKEHTVSRGGYWSPDGMACVSLTDSEPLSFGISRKFPDGGSVGSTVGIKEVPGMTEIIDVVWQDDSRIFMLVCETEAEDSTGYVFYSLDENKVISYTASQHAYIAGEDGAIMIPE